MYTRGLQCSKLDGNQVAPGIDIYWQKNMVLISAKCMKMSTFLSIWILSLLLRAIVLNYLINCLLLMGLILELILLDKVHLLWVTVFWNGFWLKLVFDDSLLILILLMNIILLINVNLAIFFICLFIIIILAFNLFIFTFFNIFN